MESKIWICWIWHEVRAAAGEHWSYAPVFTASLELAQRRVSAEGPEEAHARWELHQALHRLAHKDRAEKLGKEAQIAVGFFHYGEAEELSLWDNPICPYRFEGQFASELPPLVIGRGCQDLAVPVFARLAEADLDTDPDDPNFVQRIRSFGEGWNMDLDNWCGISIFHYEPPYMERCSISGRTSYRLKLEPYGGPGGHIASVEVVEE